MIKFTINIWLCLVLNAYSQLLFDKNFDSGSLDSAYFSDGYWNINYATTLHFRVIGCTSQNPIFRIWVNPNWSWHFRASHRMVWKYNSSSDYNYMDTGWVSNGYYYFRNQNPFTSDTIFIAYLFPLPYGEMVSYMNSIQSNQWIRNAGVRGNSVLGRNIYGYEITNTALPDSLKKRIVITSRQHPYETLGNHVCMGMSDYLLNTNDTTTVWLRDNCVFYFYPMINPDGVYLGLNTDTYSGYNSNRFWYNGDTVASPSPCRETNVVRQDIWNRTGSRVYYSFDMHTNAGNLLYYYCGLKTAPKPFTSMAYDIVRKIRSSDSLLNNGAMLMPNDITCNTYQSTNWYADFWHWNNKQSVAFTLETSTVPPQSLQRTRNNGIAIAIGIYLALKNSVVGVRQISSVVPEKFELFQNYPNPFNPSTKIKFSIRRSTEYYSVQHITLKVFDILGREVATLANAELSQGDYEVEFNINNELSTMNYELNSNVYFYRLTAGNFSETKKLLLLK